MRLCVHNSQRRGSPRPPPFQAPACQQRRFANYTLGRRINLPYPPEKSIFVEPVSIADGFHIPGGFHRDDDALFLHAQHQFHQLDRVGEQIFHERGFRDYLAFFDLEFCGNELFEFIKWNRFFCRIWAQLNFFGQSSGVSP